MKTQSWGYSKDGAKVFELEDGEKLPSGYYSNPASVPGSDAQKAYKADAEREGAKTPLITDEAAPEKPAEKLTEKPAPIVPPAAAVDPTPEKPAKPELKPEIKPDLKPDKNDKADKADTTK
jgi:hypothetical protein